MPTRNELELKIESYLKQNPESSDCICGSPLTIKELESYLHPDGIDVEGHKRWYYFHCKNCQYDLAIWKVGISYSDLTSKLSDDRGVA